MTELIRNLRQTDVTFNVADIQQFDEIHGQLYIVALVNTNVNISLMVQRKSKLSLIALRASSQHHKC